MGKMKSLKWSFFIYLSVCFILSFAGSMLIGFETNDLQDWYEKRHSDVRLSVSPEDSYTVLFDGTNIGKHYIITDDRPVAEKKYRVIYFIISYTQMLLIPLWIIFCVAFIGIIFYKRELQKPIEILFDASKKISENKLDFCIKYTKKNELGQLCRSFDDMRRALYESNREMWRSLEERKRLNSAFSHDLRTPLTVLKGYAEFLEKYIPDGKVSEEKLISVISMMNGQISRLEHYTQKMNTVQKLEDIVPNHSPNSAGALFAMLTETGKLICGDKFRINTTPDSRIISIDTDIVMQVYENLISNAVRYAENSVEVKCSISENILTIAVLDDGRGFTEEALKNAVQPFFRDEKEPDKLHFGLGLYICRILCEKCGGNLKVENHKNGGKVTAEFYCQEISENR